MGGLVLCLALDEAPDAGTRLRDLATAALVGAGLAISLLAPDDGHVPDGPRRALVRIPARQARSVPAAVGDFVGRVAGTWTAYRAGAVRTFERPVRPVRPADHPGQPVPGRRAAFTAPPDSLAPDEYRQRFRGHFLVTEAHTPGIWRYRQTEVEWLAEGGGPTGGGDGAGGARHLGLSEFWFTTTQAAQYETDEQRQVMAADADTFVDRARTLSFGGVEHQLRPGTTAPG